MTGAERAGHWLDRHQRIALAALLSFYLILVVAQSEFKLVWADELITFYIARQPGFFGVWRALRAGADPNPPLMHLLVKVSTAFLGANALAMRLPAILCVMLAIMAMWWILRRWVRPVFVLVGVLAFMATRGFDYAYDARSYAPMMGFAMASLTLWMEAGDCTGWRRFAALAGMALTLAAGVSSNYYGVMAFFPLAAGELFKERFRAGVWLALAAGSLPLLAFLPLIRHNIAEFGPHAWNRPHLSMIGMSYLLLVEGVFWPVLGTAIYGIWKRHGDWPLSRSETAALAVLLLYPFLGFAIAVAGAGMISPRCVVPVCCGMGLAAGVLAQRLFGNTARGGVALVLLMLVWVTVREGFCARLLWQQREAFSSLTKQLVSAPGEILVGDSSLMLPLYFYAEAATRRALIFPIDFDAIHRYEREDSGEQNIWGGGEAVFPFPVVEFTDLQPCPAEVTVLARPDGWLAHSLQAKGFRLERVATSFDWERLGGVFTPMAHAETRILRARHACG